MHALTITNLSKTFRDHKKQKITVLNGLSMNIPRGAIYALLGLNGSGKTTLMRLIAGLTFPDSGNITLFNRTNLAFQRHRIGFLIDNPVLEPDLTARDNLLLHRRLLGLTGPDQSDTLLTYVGLADVSAKRVRHFSSGMKRRLALGIALLGHPDFLILDEPDSSLDAQSSTAVRKLLKTLNESLGITILLTGHHLTEIAQIATHYGILRDGHLVEELSADTLRHHCRSCLDLTVTPMKEAVAVLESTLGIRDYEVLSDTQLRLFEQTDQAAQINRTLVEHHFDVASLSRGGQSVDVYFIQKMGGHHA